MTGPDEELAELFRDEATRRIDAMDAALLDIEAAEALRGDRHRAVPRGTHDQGRGRDGRPG